MRNFILASTAVAVLFPGTAMATIANSLTSPVATTAIAEVVALRGDGYCPDEKYSSDPDCVPRGWRGSGRVGSEDQDKSKPSRNRFPECRASGGGGPVVYTCKAGKPHPRNQFPGDRPRQPRHLG
jgi:hypothetical protein